MQLPCMAWLVRSRDDVSRSSERASLQIGAAGARRSQVFQSSHEPATAMNSTCNLLRCARNSHRCVSHGQIRSSSSGLPPFTASPAFRLTKSPNETFEIGDGLTSKAVGGTQWLEDEKQGWRSIEVSKMDKVYVLLLRRRISCKFGLVSSCYRNAYKLLTSAIVPRPIAFVSSLSASGVPNLAPFRSVLSDDSRWQSLSVCAVIFQWRVLVTQELHCTLKDIQIANNPPLLSVSFSLSPRRPKDTRENIKDTKEFVVNMISEP